MMASLACPTMTLDTGHRRDPNSTMWRMVCRFLVDKKDVPGVANRLPRSAQCTPPQSDCVALAPHRALHYCPDSAGLESSARLDYSSPASRIDLKLSVLPSKAVLKELKIWAIFAGGARYCIKGGVGQTVAAPTASWGDKAPHLAMGRVPCDLHQL